MTAAIRQVDAFYEVGSEYGFQPDHARSLLNSGVQITARYAGPIALRVRGVRLPTTQEALKVEGVNLPTDAKHTMLLTKRKIDYEDGEVDYGALTGRYVSNNRIVGSRILISMRPESTDFSGWKVVEHAAHETSHALGFKGHCAVSACIMREAIPDYEPEPVPMRKNPFCGDCGVRIQHLGQLAIPT